MQHSTDGGVTWSAAARVHIPVTGVIPVVQPNGALTLVFWSPRTGMVAVRSTNGGATLGAVTIAAFRFKDSRPFRAPPVPAADVDGAGRVVAVWHDCRFSPDDRRTTSSARARPTERRGPHPLVSRVGGMQ